MRVEWTDYADMRRDQVADYIRDHFGAKYKNRFINDVRKITKMLRRNPNIGSIDPLFADRPVAYRSIIINGLSKMVYRIDDDTIYIVGFWDTRQEPAVQAAQVKE
ncbi:MAG: type II toxin-antitoxin system RelE/ParE family toxin [Bacteroidaceae bacterium]|nr:type II toxin-antitoxin system RelE/ParE family toxin [Bacteroidaceae bacterium]